MASPSPVLPDVHSTIVPPCFRRPSFSAASTMARPMRSFTLPPGLKNSSLASTGQGRSFATRRSRTSGVRPTVSRMLSWYCTPSRTLLTGSLLGWVSRAWSGRRAPRVVHGGRMLWAAARLGAWRRNGKPRRHAKARGRARGTRMPDSIALAERGSRGYILRRPRKTVEQHLTLKQETVHAQQRTRDVPRIVGARSEEHRAPAFRAAGDPIRLSARSQGSLPREIQKMRSRLTVDESIDDFRRLFDLKRYKNARVIE